MLEDILLNCMNISRFGAVVVSGVSTPGITKVIGYGAETEAPSSDDLPGSAVLKPGDVMRGGSWWKWWQREWNNEMMTND